MNKYINLTLETIEKMIYNNIRKSEIVSYYLEQENNMETKIIEDIAIVKSNEIIIKDIEIYK